MAAVEVDCPEERLPNQPINPTLSPLRSVRAAYRQRYMPIIQLKISALGKGCIV
jgi:hypothetical protein